MVRTEIPPELAAAAEKARAYMVEAVADKDETVLEAYMESPDVPADVLREGIRRLVCRNQIVPVLCGSSLRNKGVQQILDAVVDYLPSPLEVPPVEGTNPRTGEKVTREADDSAPAAALAFKIAKDDYVGRLVFVRVYSGQIKKGQNIFNPRLRRRVRLNGLVRMRADSRSEVDTLYAGEIGAVIGLKEGSTGDTLCAEQAQIELERIPFPEPVISMAVEPRTRADKDKLEDALQSLAAEDPTCVVRHDEETGQTLISGMGELHLEVLKERMIREFRVEANTGKPMVVFYETVTQTGSGSSTFDREIGGKRVFAGLTVEVSPGVRGSGNRVEFALSDSALPGEFRESVKEGISDACLTGVLARYPVTDIVARVTAAQADAESSTDVAFRTVAVMALRESVMAARPEFLEPIMSLEIVTPDEYLGDVLGDLNGRRGKIRDVVTKGNVKMIGAGVPLAELFGYATAVRSLTRGRAAYTMEPEEFSVVPKTLRAELLNR